MATVDDVRLIANSLPRTVERLVQDRVKFNVGRIVYVALSRDEQIMGFSFPKAEREQLVSAEPHKFQLPNKCVPKSVAADYDLKRASP